MTYKTKNATIVFAFVAMLLVAPLAQVAIAEETTSSVTPACGFTTQNIVVPAMTRDAEQAEGTEVTFPLTGGANTASGTFSVTATTNWKGDGDRATTTIQAIAPVGRVLAASTVTAAGEIATGTVLTIGGTDVFTAGSGTTGANQFDIDGAAAADVIDLVRSINALGAKTTAVVTNPTTITLTAKTGTLKVAADAITVVSGDASLVATEATLGAGTAGIDGTSITLNSNVYIAAVGAKLSNLEFSMDGDNNADAEALAVSINAQDSALRATTDTTDIVTVLHFVRGTGGNAIVITTTDDAKLDIPAAGVLTGGGDNIKDHLLSEQTKFKVTKDGTTTSQGTSYTNKIAMNAVTVAKEMVAATNDDKNLRVSFQTSTEATATPVGIVTMASVNVGDTVTVNGLIYEAVAGAHAGDLTKFDQSGTDTQTATDLALSITTDTRTGLFGDVTAAGVVAVVTITHGDDGVFGNQTPLLSSDAGRLLTSGVTLGVGTGGVLGAEPLINLPYDGALKMTVTFTVNCS